jgi:hypothetical protein
MTYTVGTFGGHEEGHPDHVPAMLPIYGGYSSWMVVRGIETDEPAYPSSDFTVWGMWLNDPKPGLLGGIGENVYKTFTQLTQFYLEPIISDDAYNGQYVAVIPMPQNDPVPTISEWGVAVMTLLLLTAGTLVFMRRHPARA